MLSSFSFHLTFAMGLDDTGATINGVFSEVKNSENSKNSKNQTTPANPFDFVIQCLDRTQFFPVFNYTFNQTEILLQKLNQSTMAELNYSVAPMAKRSRSLEGLAVQTTEKVKMVTDDVEALLKEKAKNKATREITKTLVMMGGVSESVEKMMELASCRHLFVFLEELLDSVFGKFEAGLICIFVANIGVSIFLLISFIPAFLASKIYVGMREDTPLISYRVLVFVLFFQFILSLVSLGFTKGKIVELLYLIFQIIVSIFGIAALWKKSKVMVGMFGVGQTLLLLASFVILIFLSLQTAACFRDIDSKHLRLTEERCLASSLAQVFSSLFYTFLSMILLGISNVCTWWVFLALKKGETLILTREPALSSYVIMGDF
eukprot:TRINITY_DN5843_c0_g1_i1.p1 TRINITY_DN5843_c0_g1~~TRINITY_DN5843_c0_g1_i1.p1  ORF type:complete len:376 (-),score=78.86 TRINITY_DN5843_c0_g1_i1:211-1338(-)